MLFISSLGVTIFVGLLLILVITALVLAAKSESNLRFLIWGAIILFVPFLGAIACIINYYVTKNKIKSA
ncbi:hypothetical protein [uncultured Polaribacter sp.]|uniref:hypothetical protein n=1 Tax=uncultured Polaribacter sp. TaxID=174711 RepID=UPI00261A1982|nr:hypothetical protein [uncultured Polaribacter sp.]